MCVCVRVCVNLLEGTKFPEAGYNWQDMVRKRRYALKARRNWGCAASPFRKWAITQGPG